MLLAARLGERVMIKVERLHYGKLVSDNGAGVVSSGLGVTLRSKGLSPAWAADLQLDSLLDVKVFDPDMIDPAMSQTGLLIVRTFPRTNGPFSGRTILVRARFRPERGEGAGGRVHQQAAIWVVSSEDWKEYAASILAKAGSELKAVPDRAEEEGSKRFDGPPLPIELLKADEGKPPQRTEQVRRILDTLLPSELSSGAALDFGIESFKSESEFLSAVGAALKEIVKCPYYRHWPDICIGSGLRQPRSGLLIRYLPSERFDPPAPIDDNSVNRRLKELSVRPAAPNEKWKYAILEPAQLPSPSIAPPASQWAGERTDPRPSTFGEFLNDYRRERSPEAARLLMDFVAEPKGVGPATQFLSNPRVFLTSEEQNARGAINLAIQGPSGSVDIARAFDCCLFLETCGEISSHQASRALWWEKLRRELLEIGILLPAEVARLERTPFFASIKRDPRVNEVIIQSERLRKWFYAINEYGYARGLQGPERYALKELVRRLTKLPERRPGDDTNLGLHGDVVIGAHVLLSDIEFRNLAREFLLPVLNALLPS
jgi:hypothetical protein